MNFFTFTVLFAVICWASEGDKSEWYQECVQSCQRTHTVDWLISLFWSTKADCKYRCMRQHNQLRKENNQKVVQYYGKWPFQRVMGCQEIASAVFSIGNAWAQIRGYRRVHWRIKNSVMHRYWLGAVVMNLNGWLWSTIFHTRDTNLTERLDYFSAVGLVLYAVYYTLVSFFAFYAKPFGDCALRMGFILFYVLHIRKLLIKFDYGYNMAVTAGAGLLFNFLWIISYFLGRTRSKLSLICAVLFLAAGCLEIFDFPPIWEIFDAHSLWHLATIPITLLWWRFLGEHALELPMSKN